MVKNCLIASIGYACLDILFLVGLASGSLGISPFELMWFLTFGGVVGGILSLVLLAMSRKTRFTLLTASLMLVLFAGVTLLNVWCLHLASAAV